MVMLVYLDDVRTEPKGWERAYTADEAIELLKTREVDVISLDHDLGYEIIGEHNGILLAHEQVEKTGYDVLLWIEEAVVLDEFEPPEMFVHSANPVGVAKMKTAIEQIHRLWGIVQGESDS